LPNSFSALGQSDFAIISDNQQTFFRIGQERLNEAKEFLFILNKKKFCYISKKLKVFFHQISGSSCSKNFKLIIGKKDLFGFK